MFGSGRAGLFGFFLGIFLLFHFAKAKENKIDPTNNVNLGPIQQWRSAYYCLQYMAANGPCQPNHILKPNGNITVAPAEMTNYCSNGGCGDHITKNVLKCIKLVKKDFKFMNKGTLEIVTNVITGGCNNPSQGIHFTGINSGMKNYQKTYMSLLSGLLVFVAIFNM